MSKSNFLVMKLKIPDQLTSIRDLILFQCNKNYKDRMFDRANIHLLIPEYNLNYK